MKAWHVWRQILEWQGWGQRTITWPRARKKTIIRDFALWYASVELQVQVPRTLYLVPFMALVPQGQGNNLLSVARRLGYRGLSQSVSRITSMARNRMYPRSVSLRYRLRNSQRQRKARSMIMNRNRRTGSSGTGVTQQRDSKTIYVKKRMTRRRRNAWKKFTKKVHFVAEKDLGTQTAVINENITTTNNTTPIQQLMQNCALYGVKSGSILGYNDLFRIATYINQADQTAVKGLTAYKSTKVLFQSGILDLTIRNSSGVYTTYPASVYTSEARLEVDVYEVSQRSLGDDGTTFYNDILAEFDQGPADTDVVGGTLPIDNEIAIYRRGCTPWDLPYVLSRFGIKIWRKTKYTIGSGDQITYQIRDPRRHVMNMDQMLNADGHNRPGLTRHLIILAKLSPGLDVGAASGKYFMSMSVGCTRKYSFKMENYTEDRTLYLN